MTNRYQDDLKLIVGVDSLAGGIEPPVEKNAVKGKRGITYFNSDGSTETTSGNPPSDPDDASGEDDDEDSYDDPSTQPGGGGGGAGGGDGSGGNGGNALDDTPIPTPTDPSDPGGTYDDLKDDGTSYGGLTGLQDCESGQPIDVRYDGKFPNPEGWDNPDHGPVPEGYEEGYYWAYNNQSFKSSSPSATAQLGADSSVAALEAAGRTIVDVVIFPVTLNQDGTQTTNQLYEISYYISDPGAISTSVDYSTLFRYACAAITDDYCTVSPIETEWPPGTTSVLSYNAETGKFESHPGDTNMPQYLQGGIFTIPELCGPEASVTHFPQANGDIAVYDSVSGIAKFINPVTGKVTGYGDGAAVTAGEP